MVVMYYFVYSISVFFLNEIEIITDMMFEGKTTEVVSHSTISDHFKHKLWQQYCQI